jgi:hypothetical protein
VLQARELNAQKQKELIVKRVAAIQEVLEAARPLVKALKDERKARVSLHSESCSLGAGWWVGCAWGMAACWLGKDAGGSQAAFGCTERCAQSKGESAQWLLYTRRMGGRGALVGPPLAACR